MFSLAACASRRQSRTEVVPNGARRAEGVNRDRQGCSVVTGDGCWGRARVPSTQVGGSSPLTFALGLLVITSIVFFLIEHVMHCVCCCDDKVRAPNKSSSPCMCRNCERVLVLPCEMCYLQPTPKELARLIQLLRTSPRHVVVESARGWSRLLLLRSNYSVLVRKKAFLLVC